MSNERYAQQRSFELIKEEVDRVVYGAIGGALLGASLWAVPGAILGGLLGAIAGAARNEEIKKMQQEKNNAGKVGNNSWNFMWCNNHNYSNPLLWTSRWQMAFKFRKLDYDIYVGNNSAKRDYFNYFFTF
ncbi:MAG: hypothetical protein AB1567_05470 [bacterium]